MNHRLFLSLFLALSSSNVASTFSTRSPSSNVFRSNAKATASAGKNKNKNTNANHPFLQIRGGSDISTSTATSLNSAPVAAVATIATFWQTSPYAAGAIVCAVKASVADMFAQKAAHASTAKQLLQQQQQQPQHQQLQQQDARAGKTDLRRNLAFILYGITYQGMGCEFIYNRLYPVWFGRGTAPTVVLSKVLFNLLFQATLVTLPTAYLIKGFVFRRSTKDALRHYISDIKNHGLIKKYYALWFPVDCIIFSVVPEHFRVTVMAMVSFIWMMILSNVSSRDE
mmetsp:Transcript_2633/g.3838  ORF Transcript_2633/g.3838 Transcript_2633/m.3838 type:complete len:283 (-) Transcript_2633:152-1000(-)